jgi:Aspartyl/Asparaginyl beta-hydroxylase
MNTKKWDTHTGYIKCKNLTELLDTIPAETFSNSLHEIVNNKDLFKPHILNPIYLESGPLRECITVHLITNNKEDLITNKIKYHHTFSLLEKLKNLVDTNSAKELTRAYVTILGPNKTIHPHSDTDGKYWNEITRYQFYYTGNNDVIQLINNTVFPVGPGYLYLFDHKQIHEYHNNSAEDLLLMVFDLKN